MSVIHASGSLWKEHRRFCLRMLRDFGMGRSDGETRILDECRHLVSHLANNLNYPVQFTPLIKPAINNTICTFLFNKRYQYSDSQTFNRMAELELLMISISAVWKPIVYSEKLMNLPGDVFGYKESRRRLENFYGFINEHIEEYKRKPKDDGSFIASFMMDRQSQLKSGQLTTFTETQLKHTIMDLFMAGTDTTVCYLNWAILLLSYYPKLQHQLYTEIHTHLGHNTVSMQHKPDLNYTEAFIMEVHRFASISPVSLPHTNLSEQIRLQGYTIPKGSSLVQNIYAVHRDEEYWKFPNEFNPENFLDAEGKVVYHDRLIPFSIGKRSCVGEPLARMEIFLILVSLVQRFRFSLPADRAKPKLVGSMQMMNYAPAYQVVITDRKTADSVANGYEE